MKKFRDKYRNLIAIENRFFRILKRKGKYNYVIKMPKFMGVFSVYKGGKSKIWNRYTLTFVWLLCMLLSPLLLVFVPLIIYINGAKNFITDSAFVDDVRSFTYANLVIILVLTLVIIL